MSIYSVGQGKRLRSSWLLLARIVPNHLHNESAQRVGRKFQGETSQEGRCPSEQRVWF
jgi:hypothetical protein